MTKEWRERTWETGNVSTVYSRHYDHLLPHILNSREENHPCVWSKKKVLLKTISKKNVGLGQFWDFTDEAKP